MKGIKVTVIILLFFLTGTGILWAETPDIAEGLYRNALSLLNQGLAEQALKDFWKIVRLYPNSKFTDDSLYLIGKHHFETKEYDKSLEALNQVINSYGSQEWAPGAYYLKASIYMDSSYDKFDYKVAYANFSRIFSIYKDRNWVDKGYYGSGQAVYKLHDYDKALELFHHVTEEFPESELAPKAQFYIGMCYILEDHTVWSLQAFQKVIDNYPTSEFAGKAKGMNSLIYKTRFLKEQGQQIAYKLDKSFHPGNFRFDHANAIAIDIDGNIAVSNKGEGALYLFDENGKFKDKKRIHLKLRSLFYTYNGELIIGTKTRVIRKGKTIKFFFQKKDKADELSKIELAVIDQHGDTYIVDGKHSGILKFVKDKTRKVKKSWPNSSLKKVKDIVLDFEGYIFAIDSANHRLIKFQTDGKELDKIAREGNNYKMKELSKIEIDPIGNIYILDIKKLMINIFSKDMKFIQKVQLTKKPVDFSVNYKGEILILNSKEKSIQKYL